MEGETSTYTFFAFTQLGDNFCSWDFVLSLIHIFCFVFFLLFSLVFCFMLFFVFIVSLIPGFSVRVLVFVSFLEYLSFRFILQLPGYNEIYTNYTHGNLGALLVEFIELNDDTFVSH